MEIDTSKIYLVKSIKFMIESDSLRTSPGASVKAKKVRKNYL